MVLVDKVHACRAASDILMQEVEVAVDLEGVDLGRHPGSVCVIQACGKSRPTVYLFDITTLGERAFEEGGLKEFFEAPEVRKVFFDVRSDTDALRHNHGVRVAGAYDLQVLYHMKFCHPQEMYLKGLKVVLDAYGRTEIPSEEKDRLKALKEVGKKLFTPERGGSYSVWEQRPLPEALERYCEADVQHLLWMKELWNRDELQDHVLEATAKRIADFTGLQDVPRQLNRVDFATPGGLQTECIEREVIMRQGTVGRVIGEGGEKIKSIQSDSGASVVIPKGSLRACVRGVPWQVEEAERLIVQAMGGRPRRLRVP